MGKIKAAAYSPGRGLTNPLSWEAFCQQRHKKLADFSQQMGDPALLPPFLPVTQSPRAKTGNDKKTKQGTLPSVRRNRHLWDDKKIGGLISCGTAEFPGTRAAEGQRKNEGWTLACQCPAFGSGQKRKGTFLQRDPCSILEVLLLVSTV